MKSNLLIAIFFAFSLFSCEVEQQPTKVTQQEILPEATPPQKVVQEFENKGHELVYNMVQKTGNYNKFLEKKDVLYTYTYTTPDGKSDISNERYIFNGELSAGSYQTHERTFPNLEGPIEQGYDGNNYWLKHNGVLLSDDKMLQRVAFNRPTNFYWFAMMPKLLDPGLLYEYIGEKEINSIKYDIVKVSFETIEDKPKDIYQVYINKETNLVDQFLFTVADFGRMDPLLMKVEYETIEGLSIPTKRKYKASDWEATDNNDPWISVNWTNIKFNNNLTQADFKS
ncbi:MAG: hypothetical protein ACRBFS_26615 [Aureispira sp.]